ncbi:hypothetical protein C8R46DRAFT_1235780 [Mycena filopes]|nr:hypothetical protein C8R46DRAFT_1235780 [Mycena filopes]
MKTKKSNKHTLEDADEELPRPLPVPIQDRITPEVEARLAKCFEREMRNRVAEANENQVVMNHFSFERAEQGLKQLASKKKPPRHNWMDGISRCAMSNDGVPLIFHVPQAMKPASTAILFEQLVDFGASVHVALPKTGGADGAGRGAVKSYIDIPGQIAGIFKMVKGWHAVGHPYNPAVVSSHIIKTGNSYSYSFRLMAQLRLVSLRINSLIQHADNPHYDGLKELKTKAEDLYEHIKSMNSGDPLLMEGREIMYNRKTGQHTDRSDPKRGWAVLVVVGPFKEEEFCPMKLRHSAAGNALV